MKEISDGCLATVIIETFEIPMLCFDCKEDRLEPCLLNRWCGWKYRVHDSINYHATAVFAYRVMQTIQTSYVDKSNNLCMPLGANLLPCHTSYSSGVL